MCFMFCLLSFPNWLKPLHTWQKSKFPKSTGPSLWLKKVSTQGFGGLFDYFCLYWSICALPLSMKTPIMSKFAILNRHFLR